MAAAVAPTDRVDSELSDHHIEVETIEQQRTNKVDDGILVSCIIVFFPNIQIFSVLIAVSCWPQPNAPVSPFHKVTRIRSRNPRSDDGTGPSNPAAPHIDETHPNRVEADNEFDAAVDKVADSMLDELLHEYFEKVAENAIATEWPSNEAGVETSNAKDSIASREQQVTNNVSEKST